MKRAAVPVHLVRRVGLCEVETIGCCFMLLLVTILHRTLPYKVCGQGQTSHPESNCDSLMIAPGQYQHLHDASLLLASATLLTLC